MSNTLFIDGSNLYGGMSELLPPDQYIEFSSLLKVIEKDFPVGEVKFYGTYMRIDPSKSVTYRLKVETQKAFFDSAKNCKKVFFSKGTFQVLARKRAWMFG